jgi:hypothetical protein
LFKDVSHSCFERDKNENIDPNQPQDLEDEELCIPGDGSMSGYVEIYPGGLLRFMLLM